MAKKLKAYVFFTKRSQGTVKKIPTIFVIFMEVDGVGGSARWTFSDARRYAKLGMVAISIGLPSFLLIILPQSTLWMTQDMLFRWGTRKCKKPSILIQLKLLDMVYLLVVHLVTAASIDFPDSKNHTFSSKPNLLLLWSPALDTTNDGWF